MNRAGDDFLADPALSAQEDGRVGYSHLGDEVADRLHLAARARHHQGVSHQGLLVFASAMQFRACWMHENAGDVPIVFPTRLSSDYKQLLAIGSSLGRETLYKVQFTLQELQHRGETKWRS